MSATASPSIESSVKDHISLILAGKALEGLEKYYAEDAVMQENDQPPRVGKATNRAFEQDFFSKVTTVRTFANDGYVVSGNRAFVVWRVDIDHAEWGTINTTQVAVQEWKDGRSLRPRGTRRCTYQDYGYQPSPHLLQCKRKKEPEATLCGDSGSWGARS